MQDVEVNLAIPQWELAWFAVRFAEMVADAIPHV